MDYVQRDYNILFWLYISCVPTEYSAESNYVPGSFSAKGRSKLRASNQAPILVPANFDKIINQVRYFLNEIPNCWINFYSIRSWQIGWTWIKIWQRTTMLMLAISKRFLKRLINKKWVLTWEKLCSFSHKHYFYICPHIRESYANWNAKNRN